MTNAVTNNPAEKRFELEVDGHVAAACYEQTGGVITFEHTEVRPALGGRGIGSRLVKGALDQVRADGLEVVAQCPFVRAWIGNHPDYATAEVLAAPRAVAPSDALGFVHSCGL